MIFRKGGHLSVKEKCVFGNQRLEVVNLYKYLGFIFSTKLSFDVATNGEHLTRVRRGTFEIIKTLRKLGCSSPSLFFKLFDAQIVPSLLYGSEMCGIKARESIENVHIQACKLFLNVPPPPPLTIWCTENWEDSHCIFRLQLVVCNTGSDYDDSLCVVIPEKHTICYMDYKKK